MFLQDRLSLLIWLTERSAHMWPSVKTKEAVQNARRVVSGRVQGIARCNALVQVATMIPCSAKSRVYFNALAICARHQSRGTMVDCSILCDERALNLAYAVHGFVLRMTPASSRVELPLLPEVLADFALRGVDLSWRLTVMQVPNFYFLVLHTMYFLC